MSLLAKQTKRLLPAVVSLRLAEAIKLKGLPTPGEIILSLRDAIEKRASLGRWWREQPDIGAHGVEANLRHEFFRDTLQSVYDKLRTVMTPHKSANASSSRNTSSAAQVEVLPELINRFDSLYDESGSDVDPETPSAIRDTPMALPKTKKPDPSPRQTTRDYDILVDDIMAMYLESFLALINLDNLLGILKSTWTAAGKGEIPFSVAAATSRAVWSWSARDLNVLSNTSWTQDYSLFLQLTKHFKRSGCPPGWKQIDLPASMECTRGDGLVLAFHVLDKFIQKPTRPTVVSVGEDASARVSYRPERERDGRVMKLMLQSMIFYEVDEQYNESNLLEMTQEWFTNLNNERERDRVRVAFYLRFLLESTRAYQFANGVDEKSTPLVALNPPENARSRMLQHADEVKQTYVALSDNPFGKNCCSTSFGGTAKYLTSTLQNLLTRPNYDLYFSCPSVCGDTMIKIGDVVLDFGKTIANHRQYLASVLHVDNALRVMGDVKPIPVLDELCLLFEDIIFLGTLPTTNFNSIFARYRDAKVQFGQHTGRRGTGLGSSSKWAMKLAESDYNNDHHTEKNAKRFEVSIDTTVMGNTGLDGVHANDWYIVKVLNLKDSWVQASDETLAALTAWLRSHHINNHPLLYIREQITNEFNGRPIPSVDLPSPSPSIGRTATKATKSKHRANCACDACLAAEDATATIGPYIRASVGRPTCNCHKDMSRLRVLAKERRRGTGLLPVMRLNLGAVWLACAEAFGQVNEANKHHAKVSHEAMCACLCQVDDLLRNTDAYVKRQKKSFKFAAPQLKKRWVDAIEEFRNQEAKEFMWKWM